LITIEEMDIIKQMMARRNELGLTNEMVSATSRTPAKEKTPPVNLSDPTKGRKSLRELRADIIKKKPKAKAVKKFIEESITRLTCESSDDEDV
jgi:hypothetical protein